MKRNELKTTEDFINRSKEIYKDLMEKKDMIIQK